MNKYELSVKKTVFSDNKQVQLSENIIVRVPSEPSEMTMRQWSDFHLTLLDVPEWFREVEFEDEKGLVEIVRLWDEQKWMEFYISIGKLLAAVSPDKVTLEQLLSTPFKKASDGDGIIAMYAVLVECINKYKPKEREYFVHKGDTYVVPKSITNHFGITTVGHELTTIQSIEALQFSQVLNSKDSDGNHLFEDRRYQTDLALLATLCRKVKKDGSLENMPLDFQKRRSWVDQRMSVFSDVSFDIALDIDFFLSGLLSALVNTRIYSTLSTVLSIISRTPNEK